MRGRRLAARAGACAAGLAAALAVRATPWVQPTPVASPATPHRPTTADAPAPAAARPDCPPGWPSRQDLERWEQALGEARKEIARFEALRAILEGTDTGPSSQDPDALEPGILAALQAQEARVELEALDCSAYPCIAQFIADNTPGRYSHPALMDTLHALEGWEHRAFGGMQVPLGDNREFVLLTIFESEPTEQEEARAQSRMAKMARPARAQRVAAKP